MGMAWLTWFDMHCGRASQPLLGITLVSLQAKHQSRVHQQLLPFPCKLLQLLLNLNLLRRRSSICRPIDHSVSSQAFCQPLLCQSDLKVIFKHNFLIFLNITFLYIFADWSTSIASSCLELIGWRNCREYGKTLQNHTVENSSSLQQRKKTSNTERKQASLLRPELHILYLRWPSSFE